MSAYPFQNQWRCYLAGVTVSAAGRRGGKVFPSVKCHHASGATGNAEPRCEAPRHTCRAPCGAAGSLMRGVSLSPRIPPSSPPTPKEPRAAPPPQRGRCRARAGPGWPGLPTPRAGPRSPGTNKEVSALCPPAAAGTYTGRARPACWRCRGRTCPPRAGSSPCSPPRSSSGTWTWSRRGRNGHSEPGGGKPAEGSNRDSAGTALAPGRPRAENPPARRRRGPRPVPSRPVRRARPCQRSTARDAGRTPGAGGRSGPARSGPARGHSPLQRKAVGHSGKQRDTAGSGGRAGGSHSGRIPRAPPRLAPARRRSAAPPARTGARAAGPRFPERSGIRKGCWRRSTLSPK